MREQHNFHYVVKVKTERKECDETLKKLHFQGKSKKEGRLKHDKETYKTICQLFGNAGNGNGGLADNSGNGGGGCSDRRHKICQGV